MTGRPPAGGKLDICGTRRRPESSAAWIVQLSGGLTACPGRKQTWLGAGEQALDVRVGGALAAEAVAVEGPVAVGGAGRLQAQPGRPGPPTSGRRAPPPVSTTPASTIALATCGRPRAPSPASSLTRSSSTGAPSSRSRSTIRRVLLTRPSKIQARLAANTGSSGADP